MNTLTPEKNGIGRQEHKPTPWNVIIKYKVKDVIVFKQNLMGLEINVQRL